MCFARGVWNAEGITLCIILIFPVGMLQVQVVEVVLKLGAGRRRCHVVAIHLGEQLVILLNTQQGAAFKLIG